MERAVVSAEEASIEVSELTLPDSKKGESLRRTLQDVSELGHIAAAELSFKSSIINWLRPIGEQNSRPSSPLGNTSMQVPDGAFFVTGGDLPPYGGLMESRSGREGCGLSAVHFEVSTDSDLQD